MPNTPRKVFLKGYLNMMDILEKNKSDGSLNPDEVKFVQKFLVKYGYLIQLGKEDPVNGEYDKKTKEAVNKIHSIVNTAPPFRKKFRKELKNGVENPVIARGKVVEELQDLLAVSGYMSLVQVDKDYGRITFGASVKCTKDWIKFQRGREENNSGCSSQ